MVSAHASRATQTDAAHPALTWSDNPELSGLFTQAGVDGTFVLYDTTTGHITYHNKERAGTRFIPASTFKIPNSLIGLSTGAVGDVEELLPYGGKPQYLKVWEQDMGLRDAIRVSNVPVYQELARRIGLERMRKHLVLLDYGNHDAGNVVDRFWLEGPLQISAYEQAIFLGRLARRELPLSAEIQRHVAEIVETDRGDEWVLYAKTGWAVTPTPDLGWWVGWIVKNDTVFSFALNIDLVDKADVAKRIELGRASLELLGIIQ
jgi:beta-lactamase class D